MRTYNDICGKKFPHFVVNNPVRKEYKGKSVLYWECTCECGKTFCSTYTNITSGKIKSCGCYSKKYHREQEKENRKIKIGDRFGILTVEGIAEKGNGKSYYICLCDCGRKIELSGSHLKNRKSFGCLSSDIIDEKIGLSAETFTHIGKMTSRNSSGYPGVCWKKDKQRWQARIFFNGKDKHLGYFYTKEEAVEARKNAEKIIYDNYSDVIDKMPNKNNAFTNK